MAKIDRITKVDITLQTAGLSEMGFNTILIAEMHANTIERVVTITDPDDLLDLGFTSTSSAYQHALAAFSQTPRPAQMKVGKIMPSNVSISVYPMEVVAGNKYTATFEGVVGGTIETEVAEYIAVQDDTTNIVAQKLCDEIAAFTKFTVTTLPPGPGVFTITGVEGIDAPDQWAVHVSTDTLAYGGQFPTSMVPELDAIYSTDADWYGLVGFDIQAQVQEVAPWVEAHELLFGIRGYTDSVLLPSDTTDIFSVLKASNYSRTFGFYSAGQDYLAAQMPHVGIMAKKFAARPGSETWANATLSGITTTPLSETEAQAVFGKNGNTFEPFRNISLTQNGKVFDGEWIDIIRFVDWLKERIRVLCTQALIDTRVPYTDTGIAIIRQALEHALADGVASGGIAPEETNTAGKAVPSYTITVPASADIPANDKASRILRNVEFTARLAGAIHRTEIVGVVHY